MSERKFVKPISHSNPSSLGRRSNAPYNFVPLPEAVVKAAASAEELPSHDTYAHPAHPHTGHFIVTLTTKSPVYVRCPLTRRQFDFNEQGLDRQGQPVRDGQTRLDDRLKNTPEFFYTTDYTRPVIPGSSLRGMLRALLEIVSYGKLTRVSGGHLVYRGVGDATALGVWYREQMLGPNQDTTGNLQFDYPSPQLKGGYLCRHNDEWAIRPAKEDSFGNSFVHVEYTAARAIGVGQGRQQCHPVYVTPAAVAPHPRPGQRNGKRLTLNFAVAPSIAARTAATAAPGGMEPAVLVESGHMGKPWGDPPSPHQKHMHCAIYEQDLTKTPLPIPRWMWDAYAADRDLTRNPRTDTRKLEKAGAPLFYLLNDKNEVVFFGPTMMFRLRYKRSIENLIPADLRDALTVDYADALFGFVRRKDDFAVAATVPPQGDKARGFASRVSVTDAELARDYEPEELWLTGNARDAVIPPILSTPKPTSFQHYLTQPTSDDKRELSHYDSPTYDEEGNERGHKTVIRGHKLYWHQGDKTAEDLTARLPEDADQMVRSQFTPDGQVRATSTQHTQFKPVRSDVSFSFRVYFENLSDAELGALCWALHPRGEANKTYYHKLGMGKPFGMGTVHLTAKLHLISRKRRYENLFDGARWQTGAEDEGADIAADAGLVATAVAAFEKDLEQQLAPFDKQWAGVARLRRIAMLLKMMEWPPPLPDWETAYVTNVQDFKNRKVLPDPLYLDSSPADLVAPCELGAEDPRRPGSAPLNPITPTEPPPIAPPPRTTKLETVTLRGAVSKSRNAKVLTVDSQEITCSNITQTYPRLKEGDTINANVTREGERAIEAVWRAG